MVEVYKTNVNRQRQAKKLKAHLTEHFPTLKINFDLEDCDHILRIEGEDILDEKIARLVRESGYRCELLE
jgi:hypothetical protein